jgi:protein-tyrosine phosphatase
VVRVRMHWSYPPLRTLSSRLDHKRDHRRVPSPPAACYIVRRSVTKPAKIALGIAAGGFACVLFAAATSGVVRLWWAWTAASCAGAATAYAANRPAWLGKRDGRLGLRALPLLPYLLALRIAFAVMRSVRAPDAATMVVPGVWVGGRLTTSTLASGVTHVVDLVAEYSEPSAVRTLPGYRSLPVLDGSVPPNPDAVLDVLRELAASDTDVLVHCDSGRGRAPTFAAALLVARGLAPDIPAALAMIRERRPVTSPTRTDLVFLAALEPRLYALRPRRASRVRGDAGGHAAAETFGV